MKWLDLDGETKRQIVVDREPGQYLGHVTCVLLDDRKTILAVYPKGHGKGPIVYKRSTDGGKTWSERLPTPPNWATSQECPTLFRTRDKTGKKRILLLCGLYPIRQAVSEDEGQTWSELSPIGDYGGIVPMGSMIRLKNGDYLAFFHDDGRYYANSGKTTGRFHVYSVRSADGGVTWSNPTVVAHLSDLHLCEPGALRSPDGKQLAVLLRENRRVKNSHVIFSNDEGVTWTKPRELPTTLTGDRHTPVYTPDGRLFISFRDMAANSPTKGDWVAWVGTYDDILQNRDGQYHVRLKDNQHAWDCAYPGVVILRDSTIVATTYGHWAEGEAPYILSVRLKLAELDQM
ncbi:MAG: sialidase family protein [Armatimonas sp.]